MVLEGKPVALTLSRDLTRAVRRGHPWVFADALRERPAAPLGAPAVLLDKKGKAIARGYYDAEGPLAFRACVPDASVPVNAAWAEGQLRRAVGLRSRLFDGQTTGYRLVNGEGDGLPGLVVDRYDDTAVVRLDGPAAEAFWRDGEGVAAWLARELGLNRVYQRERSRGGARGRALVGEEPSAPVAFREYGVPFAADVVAGQKTGFFFDQRENRRRIGGLSRGARVLNVFGYTGGFSVWAGVGGAREVTTVDLAAPAIAAAEANWALAGLPPTAHRGVAADAFAFLEAAAAAGECWDVVVLDPPSFAPRKTAAEAAVLAYTRIVTLGAAVVAPGGVLAAASCSSHVGAAEFLGACQDGVGGARRRAQLLDVAGQPPDHPAPLAAPELRYLKFVLMGVA